MICGMEFRWQPDTSFQEAFGDADLPPEVKDLLGLGSGDAGTSDGCTGRSTGWHTHPASGIPYRLTVLCPSQRGERRSPVTARVIGAASAVFLRVLDEVDSRAIAHPHRSEPARPSSMDVVMLMWDAKKVVPDRGKRVDPVHVNTGMCVRYSGGSSRVLVYRTEEAVKTMVHEVMHAYGVGDWCNHDAGVLLGSDRIFRAFVDDQGSDRRVRRSLAPTEAVVDFMAIDVCRSIFGGASEAAVVRRARVAARRLAAHLLTVPAPGAFQTTPAIEYYAIKLHLMTMADDMRRAHSRGLQRPDKQAVRRVFLSGPSVALFQTRRLPANPSGMSLRMTPKSLTPSCGFSS